ncbi:hypothetical protein OKW38_000111 [Paraburkholderia sp. MM5496-R1]
MRAELGVEMLESAVASMERSEVAFGEANFHIGKLFSLYLSKIG